MLNVSEFLSLGLGRITIEEAILELNLPDLPHSDQTLNNW